MCNWITDACFHFFFSFCFVYSVVFTSNTIKLYPCFIFVLSSPPIEKKMKAYTCGVCTLTLVMTLVACGFMSSLPQQYQIPLRLHASSSADNQTTTTTTTADDKNEQLFVLVWNETQTVASVRISKSLGVVTTNLFNTVHTDVYFGSSIVGKVLHAFQLVHLAGWQKTITSFAGGLLCGMIVYRTCL